jgi:hypothetical protein
MHAADHLQTIIETLDEALQRAVPCGKRHRLDAALQWAEQQYAEERRDQMESKLEHSLGVDAPHGYRYGD